MATLPMFQDFLKGQCTSSELNSRMYQTLLDLLQKKDKGPRHPISPSQVMACSRKLGFQMLNYEKPGTVPETSFGVRLLLVLDQGHRTEECVFDWAAKMPDLEVILMKERIDIEKFDDTFTLTGEIDRFVIDNKTNRKYIADCKSTNTHKFKRILKSGIPDESHYFQIQMYLHSKWARDQEINHGMIYYDNRDTKEWNIMEFPYSSEAAQAGIDRLKEIYKSKGSVAPQNEYLFGDTWQCEPLYCNFHDACYGGIRPDNFTVLMDTEKITPEMCSKENRSGLLRYLLTRYGTYGTYKGQGFDIVLNKLKTCIEVQYIPHGKGA